MQIVAREKTNDKATDFKAILTKIKGAEARRRVLRRHGRHRRPDAQAGARARHQGGVRFGDGACTDEMHKLAGDAAPRA